MRAPLRSIRIALLLLSFPALLGAAEINGEITNAKSGKALPMVVVSVLSPGKAQGVTATDKVGHYRIAGVAAGTAEVSVTRDGYQSQTQTVTVPVTGEVTLNFALTRSVKKSN